VEIEYTVARFGWPTGLWDLLHTEPYVHALGAMTRNQGGAAGARRTEGDLRQRVGRWQPTATTPDRPTPTRVCIPLIGVPTLVNKINNALLRADQIQEAFQPPLPRSPLAGAIVR